jgi:hypothetical protein
MELCAQNLSHNRAERRQCSPSASTIGELPVLEYSARNFFRFNILASNRAIFPAKCNRIKVFPAPAKKCGSIPRPPQ